VSEPFCCDWLARLTEKNQSMTWLGFVISENISSIIGFLYPAYKSFKALQTRTEVDDQQWLTYWTVFGFLYMVEYFIKPVLYYIPFYYELKILVLVWLAFPVQSRAGVSDV
jgi:hypothetical protein